jgi:hypothetical protein
MHRWILFAGLVVSMPTLPAAAAGTPSSYDVEVLVFENKRAELDGGEVWMPANYQKLITEIGAARTTDTLEGDGGYSISTAALTKDGTYRLLAHLRWTQTPEARSATPPVRIRSADQSLDGVVRFYISRFLHVDLNLAFSESKLELADAPATQVGAAPIFRLTEHRRIKTQEYHYFDHPKFGALVRVTQSGKP